MPEPSGPLNGQSRVVEGLVSTGGVAGLKKGSVAAAVTGSAYQALDTVVDVAHVGGAAVALGQTTKAGSLPVTIASDDVHAVAGDVAHNAADSGKPVKIGGKATSGAPTAVATGNRVDAWFNPLGALQVAGFAAGSDAQSGGGTNITNEAGSGHAPLNVIPYVWNGATTDRVRANQDATVLASAARTGTTQSADQTNHNGRGLHLVIDVTAITGAPSVTFTIQGKDALSGKYYTVLVSVAITAIGTTVLRVYPGLTAAANVTANDIVPRTWRVNAVHGNADSITYSVGASIIL